MKGVVISHANVKASLPSIFTSLDITWTSFTLQNDTCEPDLFNAEVVRSTGLNSFDLIYIQFDASTLNFELAIDLLRVSRELLRYGGILYFDTLLILISDDFSKLNNACPGHGTTLQSDDLIDEYIAKSKEAKNTVETYLRDIRDRTKFHTYSILSISDVGRYRNGEYEPMIAFTK